MRDPFPRWQLSPRMVAAAVLLFGCATSLALNWPGQLSYDSIAQLHDGRFGHYNPWHPPVMAWMLGLADAVLSGTGLFILFNTLMLYGSMLSVLWLAQRPTWAAVAAAILCVALPQFVLYQGIVWKDVLYADAATVGFVALAHAGVRWSDERVRWALVASAFLFFTLATLARQNGVIALAFGGLVLVLIARREGFRWQAAAACGLTAAIAAACMVVAASAALATRSNGASGPTGQLKLLELYDLIGEVKLDPGVALDGLARANPDLDELIRSDGVQLYTPARNDTLVGSSDLQSEFADTSPAVIESQWRSTLLSHPWDYLRVRWQVFAWVFFTPDLVQCDAIYTGVDGLPRYLRDLGLKRLFRPQDRALASYAQLFLPTPAYSHPVFAILALVLAVFLLRRRRPADLAFAGMLLGALTFVTSFFVISIACDYRYLVFLDLSTLAAIFYCAVSWGEQT